jgi:hypothetical protein
MELIIVLAIVGIIIAYLVMQRRKETTVAEQPAVGQPYLDPAAPYKVETPAPVVEAVVEVAPVAAPVVAVEQPVLPKGKKGRKPRITSDPRDVNHDGSTSEEEKRAWALADARDTNHDGVISAEEKSVAKRTAKAARKPSSKKV